MSSIPLLRLHYLNSIFARQHGNAVTTEKFLADVNSLAALLPERSHLLNLCADRYHFAVGFAAALLRGQISLLPPNLTPILLEKLARRYQGLYCLSDGKIVSTSLHNLDYPSFLATHNPTATIPDIPTEQVAAIVFTSGSTGDPVPNQKTWAAVTQSATVEATRLGIYGRNDLTLLGTVPSQHMYGFESTVLMAMQAGVVMHADKPFFPADISAALQEIHGPSVLITTPVHLRTLVAESAPLPGTELIVCATAPLPRELATSAEALYGIPLLEIYGSTETGQLATRRTAVNDEWHTFDHIKLRQIDNITFASGGHVAGELPLSDVIELRDSTHLMLHGRTADMINIGGKRTSLAHLNYHLNAIEGVRDGVFFMPDENQIRQVRLTAFVVAPNLDHQTIFDALRQRIDTVFLPRPLYKVETLPRNSTGKLPQEKLLELLAQMPK
jgi:acyl-coenzyme A synthetase/AMP-(fatty) acid ligase